MMLGGDRTYSGVGSDCMSAYVLETGEYRQAVLSDVINGVRLVDALLVDGEVGPNQTKAYSTSIRH